MGVRAGSGAAYPWVHYSERNTLGTRRELSQPADSWYIMYLAKNQPQEVGSDARYHKARVYQPALVVLHGLVVLSVLGLALLGQMPGEAAGWLVQPAVPGGGVRLRPPPRVRCPAAGVVSHLAALGRYLAESWPPVLLRSLLLWGLWAGSGSWGPAWLRLVPWGLWLWRGWGWAGRDCASRRSGVWVACRGCGRRSGWCWSGIWGWR